MLKRDTISSALKQALVGTDKCRLTTLRLIQAAIRDRDEAAKAHGGDGVADSDIVEMLQTMVRQRDVSAREFEEMGQLDLAEQEKRESQIIREFLPRQVEGDAMQALCAETVTDLDAHGLRDIGRCMSALKTRYPGQMDFVKASCVVRDLLRVGSNGSALASNGAADTRPAGDGDESGKLS
ncbi:GatB/YqeY domain-containing protein [Roseibium sp. CAU 1637]|uniref:GatB/YqeY domain-containing protein n=1 Tax=Roseibium limicola TaxID=2816037 RepID=A0A939EKY4_9HYPH|nr:GatB/YqeY domain-containing protein [Roseibium limicola]MBO0343771.1 GatB/YqeY domain-containing protein [Roseibium limicola]